MEVLWSLSSQNKVNAFVLLEINCKINSLVSSNGWHSGVIFLSLKRT